jgi:hypothetical protein
MTNATYTPLLVRGGAARLGLAQQGLVAAGWCLAAGRIADRPPPPTPSSEEEGAL